MLSVCRCEHHSANEFSKSVAGKGHSMWMNQSPLWSSLLFLAQLGNMQRLSAVFETAKKGNPILPILNNSLTRWIAKCLRRQKTYTFVCVEIKDEIRIANFSANEIAYESMRGNEKPTLARLAVNKTHSNLSPILSKNSSTKGRLSTYTWWVTLSISTGITKSAFFTG